MSELKKQVDWSSYDMLEVRVDMLGEDLVMNTFNGALKAYARTKRLREQILGFTWVDMGDDRVCNDCLDKSQNIWTPGQMMPSPPLHIGCRCSMDVILG